jgi:hypothetical protein
MTPKVCILNAADARAFEADIAHRCCSRRHHHYRKVDVAALVKTGELVWVGKHKMAAKLRDARTWVKVYVRNEYGEVISCGMQLVPGDKF